MDLTVLNLAVPSLTEELKPSSTELLWIIDIYGFMVAGWLITMGTLGDRIGRRKMLPDRRGGVRRGLAAGGLRRIGRSMRVFGVRPTSPLPGASYQPAALR
jgi:DHA2 family multidrug resistance protein-like MFS transporter